MINAGHLIVYTRDAAADRAFFRDVLGLRSVDAGRGWLIFALPAAEVAFHPAEDNGRHELFLMCDDVEETISELARHGVSCGEPSDEGWGVRTTFRLPGGGELGLYQPRHPVAFSRS